MMFLIGLFGRLGLSGKLSKVFAYGTATVAVIALCGALWLWLGAREEADDRRNQDIGGAVQREADLKQTITNAEKSNDAAEKVRSDPNAARAECMRNARNPADC